MTQETTLHMDINRQSIPKSNWLCSLQPKMDKLYTVNKNKTWADCGLYHEILIAKFRLNLKKVRKTTRPFRCDINQILKDYTEEVTNRFKRLDIIDKMPKELWTAVHNVALKAVTKIIPKKKNCKKAKWLSEEPSQIAEERRKVKGKVEWERCTQLNAEFQRIERRDKKAFLNELCKEIKKNNRMGKTRELLKKIVDIKGMFHATTGMIRDRNGKDLTEAEEIKRWWEYKQNKKGFSGLDNHNGVVTHLECGVKWALWSITMNKVIGGDRILAELFQILKDVAVKVLHSICQQIWKTQQWPQDWKRSVFIPITKKNNAKECSNYGTLVLISQLAWLCWKSFKLAFSST